MASTNGINNTTTNTNNYDDVIYLNHASQAWLDPEVQQVGQRAVVRPPWTMHAEADDQQRIRQLYATLIDAPAQDIAIMPSTSFAITLAARNIQKLATDTGSKERNKILLLQDQFNSAVYPWQEICEDNNSDKLTLEVVPYPTAPTETWTQSVLDKLTEDILVACLPPLHWSDGATLDLEEIGRVCRSKNIILIVDATQAAGIMPCSVAKIQPIMMCASVHKWLRSPAGTCLVYMAPSLHDTWLPLDQHGRSREMPDHGANWDAFRNEMTPEGYPAPFVQDARKFDSGGKPNPLLLPMLRCALEQVVQRVDLSTSQAQLKTVLQPLLDWALQNGFTMTPGPHVYHLIGIRPTFMTTEQMLQMATRLQKEHQVYLAVRCGGFRIAPYLDTTPEQIQQFIDIFSKLCQTYR